MNMKEAYAHATLAWWALDAWQVVIRILEAAWRTDWGIEVGPRDDNRMGCQDSRLDDERDVCNIEILCDGEDLGERGRVGRGRDASHCIHGEGC